MEYLDNGMIEPYAFIFSGIEKQDSTVSVGYDILEGLDNITVLSESTKEGIIIYYDIVGPMSRKGSVKNFMSLEKNTSFLVRISI